MVLKGVKDTICFLVPLLWFGFRAESVLFVVSLFFTRYIGPVSYTHLAQEDPQAKIEEEKEEAKVQLPDLKASQYETCLLYTSRCV